MKKIGIVGLGDMGIGLARNLLKNKFEVTGYDVQEERLNQAVEIESSVHELSPEEHTEALAFLKNPNLIERIAQAFDSCGLVGETTNKIAAYLACTSRKLEKPLAVIIQSSSAAGKTMLMDTVLSMFPS